jgi:hypothetical protein
MNEAKSEIRFPGFLVSQSSAPEAAAVSHTAPEAEGSCVAAEEAPGVFISPAISAS